MTDAPGVTLAGHSRASKLQAGSADPPVSARQGASVPIKLLHSSQSSIASRRHLRFTARHQLTVPRHRLSTYSRRAFAVAGPTMFNTLPDDLRDPAVSTSTFRQSLKTHLFSAYQHVWRIRGVSRNALYKCTILTYLFYVFVTNCVFVNFVRMEVII